MANITDRVPGEPTTEPDIQAISILMDEDLDAGEKRQQGGISAIAAVMSKIAKDYHGHKGAVRTVRTLEKKDDEELADFMRTFIPLARMRGLFDLNPDLMDLAGEDAGPRRNVEPDIKGDDDDQELVDAASQAGNTAPRANALEAAKAHLQSHTKADVVTDLSPAQQAEQASKQKLIDGRNSAEAGSKRAAGKPKLGIVPGSEAHH